MKKKFMPAINGLLLALQDRSILIQIVLGILVVVFGILFRFEYVEWLVVFLAIGLVVGLEIMNTCIEKVCDLYGTEENPNIRKIKDLSSGGVLFGALVALMIFIFILVHRVL